MVEQKVRLVFISDQRCEPQLDQGEGSYEQFRETRSEPRNIRRC